MRAAAAAAAAGPLFVNSGTAVSHAPCLKFGMRLLITAKHGTKNTYRISVPNFTPCLSTYFLVPEDAMGVVSPRGFLGKKILRYFFFFFLKKILRLPYRSTRALKKLGRFGVSYIPARRGQKTFICDVLPVFGVFARARPPRKARRRTPSRKLY